MKGIYALVISFPKQVVVSTRTLGDVDFTPGIWVYVGSALGTGSTRLDHRIKRHFSSTKKLHWHIDFLLDKTGPPMEVIWARTKRAMECQVAQALIQRPEFEIGPSGFGSSDCAAACGSHVLRYSGTGEIKTVLSSLFVELRMKPNSGIP
ncbi:MAG: DUF123 domain-containing protein [Candidatus Sifarchaeia archaeon]